MKHKILVITAVLNSALLISQTNDPSIGQEFIKEISVEEQLKLVNRLKEVNWLIANKGIHYFEDVGEMVTGYAYGEFYDWDLYFENIYLSYFSVNRFCRTNLEAFLNRQLNNGFVSRTIIKPRPNQHFKPFLAQIALLGSKQTGDYAWLEGRYYDRLKKYLDYWSWYCDFDKNGLSIWNSADHSGMDNQESRAGKMDEMICEGVDLNCYLVREYQAMRFIAEKLNLKEDARFYEKMEKSLTEKINTTLWDEKDKFYYDRNERTGELIRVKSVAGFIPLWLGIVPKERAGVIIKEHLLNKNEFWLNYPVATYSRQEPDYYQNIIGDECNWRGTTWIPTNYMIFHGLMKYNYIKEAKELAWKTYRLVMNQETTREYYNAENGNGIGLNPFWGWSSLGYFLPLEFELNYDPTSIDDRKIENIGSKTFKIEFPLTK